MDADEQARRESWKYEDLTLDLGDRIRQAIERAPYLVPIGRDRVFTDGITLVDVYGDGDVMLAAPTSSELDRLLDEWRALDRRYCETGRDPDWQPIQDWLRMHRVPLLKVQRRVL